MLGGPRLWAGTAAPSAWSAMAAAVVLGMWSLAANRPGNFNIHPAPREGGRLVTVGPYRWIRHPMYSAVLLFGLACALASAGLAAWALLAALAGVLWVKSSLEERWMAARHPAYAAYRERTRRFVPGLI